MKFTFPRLDAARLLCSGVTTGARAVLSSVGGAFTGSRGGAGSSRASAVPVSALLPRPSVCEGFGKRSEQTRPWRALLGSALLATLFSLLTATAALAAMTVDNTAKASYSVGPLPVVVDSNLVSIAVRTPSIIEFLEYAPLASGARMESVSETSYLASGSFTPLPGPIPLGATTPLNLTQPLPLVETSVYHENEPIFLRLTDLDQNLDPSTTEAVVVVLTLDDNGDSETLLLTETGPDTGVFTGSIQSTGETGVAGNGRLSVDQDSVIQATYTDPVDGTDTSTAAVLVDPFGVVFDTTTGLPVNDAVVTLLDAATGLPALVLGDDGVSIFPSSVPSGGTVSDSSGKQYEFRRGYYRFPFIQPGRYILSVTPPPGYRTPSTVSTSDIQDLPGAPFAIANPGSRGEEFLVNPGPAIHIDLPADPLRFNLYVAKTASKQMVSIGDYLQYKITVENTTAADADSVLVDDRLPVGFRYSKGSAKVNDAAAADPDLSADGGTMLFDIGTVAAGATSEITYVVEIAAGARLGLAENTATASGGGVGSSNTATAEVLVKEDLFRSKSIIMGRVFPDGCGGTEGNTEGLAGVRIYLEDGTYVVTDTQGMYHFEGINPGTHVVQLDLDTVPEEYRLVSCEENDRFAGTAYSQFVDLQGGTMWRADFHAEPQPKAPPIILNGSVGIELASVLEHAPDGSDVVNYAVSLPIGEVPVSNLRLTMLLPEGTSYQPGSSALDGSALPDPAAMDNVLTYRLGDAGAGSKSQVGFTAGLAPGAKDGELTTKALLTFDTTEAKNRRTPLVENILRKNSKEERSPYPDIVLHPHFEEFGHTLGEVDKLALDDIIAELKAASVTHIFVTGHTDSTRIAPRSRHIFADNYALSQARAKSVAAYLAAGLGLPAARITSAGKGFDEPVASNKTAEGRARNRRVELRILSEKVVSWAGIRNIKERSGLRQVEITAEYVPEKSATEKAKEERIKTRTMPEFDRAWLNAVDPGLAFAWPYEGYNPPIPSIKIAVKHAPGKKLRVLLNGEEIDPLYLDGTQKRSDGQVAVSLWIGVHVLEGDNRFEAVEYDQDGAEVNRIGRTIHYSSPPVKAKLVPGLSRLIADGTTPSVLAVRLTDKDGHPAREGVIGEYAVDPPYLPLRKVEELQNDPLTMSKSERVKFLVGEDGIALIELQPTTRTGEATLRFNLVTGEKEVHTWLTPGERDWILVGLAEGTAGYATVSGNMENLRASDAEENYYDDGRLAFFAKGMIQGKWLLTAAYDSEKNGIEKNDGLFGTIDPDRYYTLYGDGSAQQYDAASARSLYLKIERDQFYALFGDFSTGLSVTELSRYNRQLNGLKSEMKGDKFDFNLFISDTNQAFVKDEIRGDGTSGLYRLSRKNLIMNSESITVETRDRFKSELVLASRRLSRHIDYDIDYDAGTLFFKSPVFNRDENFNPIFIVIDYESSDENDLSYNYGGRGAVRFMENRLEVGATHVHEGRVGGEGDLAGIDVKWKISDQTTVRAEMAATDAKFNGVGANGSAYLAEASHISDNMDGRVYFREQEEGFGLGQQMGSESGTRKIGADGAYRINEKISVAGAAFRQYNLSTDAVRDMAEAETRLNEKGYSLRAGIRHAEDTFGNGDVNRSEQLTAGGSINLLGDRLILRVDHDQSLASNNENGDFPTRTTLGADYRLTEAAALFVAQEFTQGANEDTATTRIGLKAAPWTGGQLRSTLERQYTENGLRVFAVTGLQQTWQVSKKWSIDAGLDRSDTIKHPGNTPFNANVPAASGDTDFTAVTGGAAYKEEKWSWTGRLEIRNAANEDKIGFFTGLYGEVREGLGLSAGLQAFKTEAASGLDKTSGDLRFGLAYRPRVTKWIVLDRLDYLFDEQKGVDFDFDNWRLVNNLNANWKMNRKTQISLQYGAKYVHETIDSRDYSGFTDLVGAEGRYDLTPKWDLGLRGSILHSWEVEQFTCGAGVSVGYNFARNVWLSVGYNFLGFQDKDFSRADFTAQGSFVKFRLKFDQNSVKDLLKQI